MTDRRLQRWLQDLNLGRYATLFDDNGIEWDVLADLTEEDLRVLGVPVGHRRKLIKAIRRLGEPHDGVADTSPGGYGTQRPPDGPARVESHGERRQLTVLFCDIVGSTALSQRLDPEDMLDVLQVYQRVCAKIILGLGGSISQYLGDGIVAYFGYPQAHEDDAERAVRAGLDIVAAISSHDVRLERAQHVTLAVRVGIATGIVVLGDMVGASGAEERTAIGSTPNLAARLQALAAVNTVVVSNTTCRLVGSRFELDDLGPHTMPGFSEPQRVWRVIGPLDAESRVERTVQRGLGPFIGRDPELAELRRCWRRTIAGDGARLLVVGDPGIGKSRLLTAFDAEIAATPHRRIRHHCSSFHQNTAFHPVTELILRAAGIAYGDDNDTRLSKLERLLAANGSDVGATIPLFAALFSISTAGRYPTLDISPRKQRELTLDALVAPIEALATEHPTLIVFEDVQWIDPSTEELVNQLAMRLAHLPVMIVATCRSGLAPPRFREPDFQVLPIERLDRRGTEDLLRSLLGDRVLAPSIFEQVVERTGGVPLFVEELTKAVLQSEVGDGGGEAPGVSVNGLPRSIPATIHDSLMARLDQLALPRDIAQIGSVIGRSFSYSLLREVTGLSEAILSDALQRLAASELIYCRGAPPASSYTFKHALVQDAAYESLLLSRRRELHQRIADVLETRVVADATVTPELVAHHFTMAGAGERAVPFWLRAATAAEARSATVEQVNHLRRALAVAKAGPETPEQLRRELDVRLRLAAALIALTGAGSADVEQSYREALDLCARLPESALHFTALWGWWRISMNFRTGWERSTAMLALAERLGDPDLIMQAHHCLWATKYNLGDQRDCLVHIERGLALYREETHGRLASLYGGHDARVCAHGEAAQSLWLLGYPEQALSRLTQGQNVARELGHAGSIAHIMDMTLLLHRYRGDAARVREGAAALKQFCDEKGFPDQAAKALLFTGWADAVSGHVEAGLTDLEAGFAEQQRVGTVEDFTIYLEMLAEVYQLAGRIDDGLEAIRQAFEIVNEHGIHFWEAELHRRRGALLACKGDCEGAETAFAEALMTARQQDARALQLRAANALADLWQGQHRTTEALNLLRPLLDTFPEAVGNPDVSAARQRVRNLLAAAGGPSMAGPSSPTDGVPAG